MPRRTGGDPHKKEKKTTSEESRARFSVPIAVAGLAGSDDSHPLCHRWREHTLAFPVPRMRLQTWAAFFFAIRSTHCCAWFPSPGAKTETAPFFFWGSRGTQPQSARGVRGVVHVAHHDGACHDMLVLQLSGNAETIWHDRTDDSVLRGGPKVRGLRLARRLGCVAAAATEHSAAPLRRRHEGTAAGYRCDTAPYACVSVNAF